MPDPRHITSVVVGTTTAASGGLTIAHVQTTLGLVASALGILLTVATFVWRAREHRHKMRRPPREPCDK